MSTYYRRKLYQEALISTFFVSLIFLPFLYVIVDKSISLFLSCAVPFISFFIHSIIIAKKARIEVYPHKIVYVNYSVRESPKKGEIIVPTIRGIKTTDVDIMEISTEDGSKHYLRMNGLTDKDLKSLQRELSHITPYDKFNCLSCD